MFLSPARIVYTRSGDDDVVDIFLSFFLLNFSLWPLLQVWHKCIWTTGALPSTT
jgi:hypothetical protein